jgi:hypothetical protein
MQAKDIMTVNVITVSEDTPVHEIVSYCSSTGSARYRSLTARRRS